MTILNEKKTVMKKIEKICRQPTVFVFSPYYNIILVYPIFR
jgi:hypothetical protein